VLFYKLKTVQQSNFKSANSLSEQEEDDTPKPDFKPPPEIPKEENKAGTNKKTYFVCNDRKFPKGFCLE
jgi:hypothetical protein